MSDVPVVGIRKRESMTMSDLPPHPWLLPIRFYSLKQVVVGVSSSIHPIDVCLVLSGDPCQGSSSDAATLRGAPWMMIAMSMRPGPV